MLARPVTLATACPSHPDAVRCHCTHTYARTGLLQTRMEAGERKTEAILVAQLNPNQREMLRHMQPQAVAAWWAPGHTGWAIFPMDSDTFLQVRRGLVGLGWWDCAGRC